MARETISLFCVWQGNKQLFFGLATKLQAVVGSRREKNSLLLVSQRTHRFLGISLRNKSLSLGPAEKRSADFGFRRIFCLLFLGLAKNKLNYFGSRREQICLFQVSQKSNQLMLGLAKNKLTYFGSRKEQISLFWVSQRKQSQRTKSLLGGLAKNKSAYFGSRREQQNLFWVSQRTI